MLFGLGRSFWVGIFGHRSLRGNLYEEANGWKLEIANGKWKMENLHLQFSIFHFPFSNFYCSTHPITPAVVGHLPAAFFVSGISNKRRNRSGQPEAARSGR